MNDRALRFLPTWVRHGLGGIWASFLAALLQGIFIGLLYLSPVLAVVVLVLGGGLIFLALLVFLAPKGYPAPLPPEQQHPEPQEAGRDYSAAQGLALLVAILFLTCFIAFFLRHQLDATATRQRWPLYGTILLASAGGAIAGFIRYRDMFKSPADYVSYFGGCLTVPVGIVALFTSS